MLKTCRKYLQWVQNSVFEGEISQAGLAGLIHELKTIMRPEEEDSVVIYKFRQMKYYERKVLGADKKGDGQFL